MLSFLHEGYKLVAIHTILKFYLHCVHLCSTLRKHDSEPATKSCSQGRRKGWQKLTYIASWLSLGLFVSRKKCNN